MMAIPIRNALFVAMQVAVAAAQGQTAIPAGGEAQWKTRTLASGELHEECLNLKATDRLNYAFVAQHKLDFNIHFTRAEVMHFLLKKSAVRRAEAVFRPVLARDYCMRWSNPGERAVEFRYRFSVRPG